MAQPRRFLIVATEWSSAQGGLSTFNREFCRALAAAGQDVTCFVPAVSEFAIRQARETDVKLVQAVPGPGLRSANPPELLLRPPSKLGPFDIVVGHGRVTGPYALAIRDDRFPDADYLHFFHMDPKAIEWAKEPRSEQDTMARASERLAIELDLARASVLPVAVGPVLQRWFGTYLHEEGRRVHEFLPGLSSSTRTHVALPAMSCLVIGRAEDFSLKGLDIAAKAVLDACRDGSQLVRDARLTIRGVPAHEGDELCRRLKEVAPGLNVDLEPFTTNPAEILQSLHRSSLVLMPSRQEAFGLAGLEAISEGIPVLLSDKSGLAEALSKAVPDHAAAVVVDVASTDEVARRIRAILEDNEAACERASALRGAMRPTFSWERSTAQLLATLGGGAAPSSTPPPTASSPKTPNPSTVLAERLLAASQGLLTSPKVLSTGKRLDRPELEDLLTFVTTSTTENTAVLLGPPGSGKSALLSYLADDLIQRDIAVLAIKADRLPRDVESEDGLARAIGLGGGVVSRVEALAKVRPVVVLIDQLDALCTLVDVETQRLTVLLDVIEELRRLDAVRLVVSCRTFEFEHDVRFRRFRAEEIVLQPISVEGVKQALESPGLEKVTIPPKLLELLRIPHWLDMYLRLRQDDPGLSDVSTQNALLEAFWNQRVLRTGNAVRHAEIAYLLANRMAETEELWVSSTHFAEYTVELDALERSEVLRRNEAQLRIGFAHQTLFDFVLAKSFTSQKQSLAAFVRQRNGSLFVRPIVWATLAYLRDTEFGAYHEQLEGLWIDEALPRHLRTMLLGLLGAQTEPTDREQALVVSGLAQSPQLVVRALTGSASWFSVLERAHLPPLMTRDDAALIVPFLQAALPFARPRVLELMRDTWLEQPSKHALAAFVVAHGRGWDGATTDLAKVLIDRGTISGDTVAVLLETARGADPAEACQLLRAELDRRLGELRKNPPSSPLPSEGASESELMLHAMNREPRRSFENLLDGANAIYGTVKMAASKPAEFLKQVWPWFVEVVAEIADEPGNDGSTYRHDFSSATKPDGPGPANELPVALETAIANLASTSPDEFEAFANEYSQVDTMPVHRLLAHGFSALAAARPQSVVSYLLGDRRRLVIGGGTDEESTTRLLQDVAPHLTDDAVQQLETAINSSRQYDERRGNVEIRRARRDANRDHRIRLLRALGPERLPRSSRVSLEQEERARPRATELTGRIFGGAIGSPVSLEQMRKMSDDQLLAFFAELPDSTEWDHPRRFLTGGSIQASRVFGELTKEDPSRYTPLLTRFPSATNQRPVAHGFEGIAQAGHPLRELEGLLQDLDACGFRSEEFCNQAAYALERRVSPDDELSESTLVLLESWIRDGDPSAIPPQSDRPRRDGQPILWGWLGGTVLPHGNYPVLSALTRGLLARRAPAYDRWMSILERHLSRPESEAVWRALMHPLQFAVHAGAERADAFLVTLFQKYPTLRDSRDGAILVAYARRWASETHVREWIDAIRASSWSAGEQAYGELVGLVASKPDAPVWARHAVDEALTAHSPDVLLGIIHSATHLWPEFLSRPYLTDALLRALPIVETDAQRSAIMSIFDATAVLLADDHTTRFLDALAKHPAILSGRSVRFVEHLLNLLPFAANRIATLATVFVEGFAKRPDAVGRLWTDGPHLVDIALTLQRLGTSAREQGLVLFERLFEIESYGIRDVLAEIDHGAEPGT